MKIRNAIITLAVLLSATLSSLSAQTNGSATDADAIIKQMLTVEKKQRQMLNDVVFDTEMLEGEFNDDGEFVEKAKFIKKTYIKYLADTALFHEEYLEYYKEGELKSEKDAKNQGKEKIEKKKKRKTRDISFPMLAPFYDENRAKYEIQYNGVTPDPVDGFVCHHFKVHAVEPAEGLVNGDFYVETDGFNLVRVDFAPSKLVKKMMFKLEKLNMSIHYAPEENGYWLPSQFDIEGKGKAAFFIGVKFAGTEFYRNPVINGGIDESMFGDQNGN
ncbi:MAG: hypothetical protein P1R58_05490 [bacterium]|nr:hypothetical protein [bacterium]